MWPAAGCCFPCDTWTCSCFDHREFRALATTATRGFGNPANLAQVTLYNRPKAHQGVQINGTLKITRRELSLGIVCPMANEENSAVALVQQVLAATHEFGEVRFYAVLDHASRDKT